MDSGVPEVVWLRKRVVKRRKAMAVMLVLAIQETVVAVVPVGAGEALVPDASDELRPR